MNTDKNMDMKHTEAWMTYARDTGWDIGIDDIAEWALCELQANIIVNDDNVDIGLMPWCEGITTADIEWAVSHLGDRTWGDIPDCWY